MGVSVRQKQKGGPWWVFIAHHGKRKSKLVGDYDAARGVAKEIRGALAAGDLGLLAEPEPHGVTFAEYAKQYLAKEEPDPRDPTHGLKRSTWNDYNLCVTKQLAPLLGDRPLTEIRRRDVKNLDTELQGRGLSPVNRRKHLRVLSSILSEAVDDEIIVANPAMKRRGKRRSKQGQAAKKPVQPLTDAELTNLLTTARTHCLTGAAARLTRRPCTTSERKGETIYPFREHYPFLLLLARTGMRLSEAIALKWGDVDWRGRFIEIRRASVQGEVSTPKNGKTRRVDLSGELYAVLRECFAARFEKVVAIDPAAAAQLEVDRAASLDALLFSDAGGGVLDVDNFRARVFGPLLVAAGLRHVRIHDLRHTYASLLFHKGASVLYVQEQLGHHSPSFTLSVYTHLLPGDRTRFVDLLDAAPICTPAAPAAAEEDHDEPVTEKKAANLKGK